MKIKFIIVGWHFDNFPELINGLKQLKTDNSEVGIFWSCHKEPSETVKQNFDYKVFPNLGLEDGAYQQALDYLNLDDDTILFLMHDDIVVKDWEFINICLQHLQNGIAFVGNGINYPANFNPNEVVRGKKCIEWVKDEAKHLFDTAGMVLTIRESFICTMRGYLRNIFDFEVIWEEPQPDANGKFHIGGIGNLQQSMLGYKMYKVYGENRITYLSNTYQDSEYLYECARGTQKQ
jgi:hypothetical protein